jgi:DNA-binding transcriptional MerR regulator
VPDPATQRPNTQPHGLGRIPDPNCNLFHKDPFQPLTTTAQGAIIPYEDIITLFRVKCNYFEKLFMHVFELSEMAALLGMSQVKAKNWTAGRPFKIPASERTATGTGSRNLYSIEDVYLMGLANEFSKAGFAAKAIGRLLTEIDAQRLAQMAWLTVWRAGSLKFHVREGKGQPPEGVLLYHRVNVGAMVKGIDKEVEGLRGKT